MYGFIIISVMVLNKNKFYRNITGGGLVIKRYDREDAFAKAYSISTSSKGISMDVAGATVIATSEAS